MASGVLPMVAENLPSLFWSGERPSDDFDPDMMYNGLFRSYFLVRVSCSSSLVNGWDVKSF
jgi:hypothetical protein